LIKKSNFIYKSASFLGKKIISFIEFFIQFVVPQKAFLDKNEFLWVSEVEKAHSKIINEFINARKTIAFPDINEISEEQDIVIEKNSWDFLPFYIYGIKIKNNLNTCPETAKTLEKIPNLTTAFFSVLKPGKHIKPHRGAYKGYLRLHLGVKIPHDVESCGLRFKNDIYHWKNGEVVVFDDTFVHDAWNYSEEERVVLYVDFIRPMPKILMLISKLLTRLISKSPYVKNALINLNKQNNQTEVKNIVR